MNCIEIASNLDLFVDGELSPNLMQQIQQHLSDCLECEEKYRRELLFKETVRTKLPKRCCNESLMNDLRSIVMQQSAIV